MLWTCGGTPLCLNMVMANAVLGIAFDCFVVIDMFSSFTVFLFSYFFVYFCDSFYSNDFFPSLGI